MRRKERIDALAAAIVRDTPFDRMAFMERIYNELVDAGADGTDALEVATNLVLNVLIAIVETNPTASDGGVQAIAAGLRYGFDKLASADDRLRCLEVLTNFRNFNLRPKT